MWSFPPVNCKSRGVGLWVLGTIIPGSRDDTISQLASVDFGMAQDHHVKKLLHACRSVLCNSVVRSILDLCKFTIRDTFRIHTSLSRAVIIKPTGKF